MPDFFESLFASNGFMPHGFCLKWDPPLIWLFVTGNAIIAISYYSIPAALTFFVNKRKDLVFNWMFRLFAMFIFACGTTHLIKIWTIWHGSYWLEASVDAYTGLISFITAILLWRLVPKALALPSPSQLLAEIAARESAEATVNQKIAELSQLNDELAALSQQTAVARDEAQESSRLKSQFLANMSHEIRTPMNAILGMAEILQRSELTGSQRQYAQAIREAGSSLLTLINEILDLSKIEAGKFELYHETFHPRDALQRVADLLKHQARKKGLGLKVESDATLPRLLGDQVRVRQILMNLTDNAIKFSDRGDVILSAKLMSQDGEKAVVKFIVKDEGIGLTLDDRKHLFEPFVQVDGTTSRKYGGSGLGLNISKRLIELMNGEIGVESNKEEGSAFWFTCPFTIASNQEANIQEAPGQPAHPVDEFAPSKRDEGEKTAALPSLRKERILVAEDHPLNQQVALISLAHLGFEAVLAINGKEVLTKLRASDFDLVLMDCQMPEMDGFETTRHIRQEEVGTGKHIPIIAMTANAMAGDRENCIAAGMDDYISKPVEMDELQAKLERWLPERGAAAVVSFHPDADGNDKDALDLNQLLEKFGDEMAAELIDTFIDETLKTLPKIEESVKGKDPEKVKSLAHYLKGSCRVTYARAMDELCAQLEGAARDQDWHRADSLTVELREKLKGVEAAAKTLRK